MGKVRAIVVLLGFLLVAGVLPAVPAAAGAPGLLWLNCDPGGGGGGGGGGAAGGFVCPADFAPDGVYHFDLIVENHGKEDAADLRIVIAIPTVTTASDFVSISMAGRTYGLGNFGTSEYNPFDEAFGGRHNVFSGDDAIWVVDHVPETLPAGDVMRIPVEVVLGDDPSGEFMIHFDAFDGTLNYHSPDGHDVTFLSREKLPGGGNEPPVANPCQDLIEQPEGSLVSLDGSCSYDPDGTIVAYAWDFDVNVDSSGDGVPDNDVDSTDAVATFTWYDDYATEAKLTVVDNEGAWDTAEVVLIIFNVPPTVEFQGAFVDVTIGLRVAGEKWHNVNATVYRDYGGPDQQAFGTLYVERWPGSPDRNPSVGGPSLTARVDLSRLSEYTVIVTYWPFADLNDLVMGDQPINGQPWGANPVWLTLTFSDGTTCKCHHTFNVQQSIVRDRDHWNFVEPWIVPLGDLAGAGVPIEFRATATDPGTDDLTFTWDWGDGTTTSTDYLYDSIRGPDPEDSPYEPYLGGPTPPLTVVDVQSHTYAGPGTYHVILKVTDDDGGTSTLVVFDIVLTSSSSCK